MVVEWRTLHRVMSVCAWLFGAGTLGMASPPAGTAPTPPRFVTEHRLMLGGGALDYLATASEMILRDGEGNWLHLDLSIDYMHLAELGSR